jgi:hypothetical protein
MTDELPERLLAVLRTATSNPRLDFAAPPEPLTGGFWAELLAFRLVGAPAGFDGDLVARVMPDAAVARKETLVQAEVARCGFPTPKVRAAGGPGDGTGPPAPRCSPASAESVRSHSCPAWPLPSPRRWPSQ